MVDMGMANYESDVNQQANNAQMQRPKFYPCSDCGRKFTKLALEVHKKSCSEDENCSCKVCKSINNNCLQTKAGKSVLLNPEESPEKEENNFRDLGVLSSQNSSNHENTKTFPSNSVISDNQCNGIESSSKKDTEESLEKSPGMKPKTLKRKRVVFTDSLENSHNGEPCTRKLFCGFCKQHVPWDTTANHAFSHCNVNENNHLECLACKETRSTAILFLMHFHTHFLTHPSDCSECICSHPRCFDLMKTPFFVNPCAGSSYHSSIRCYICIKSFPKFESLISHMTHHIKLLTYSCPNYEKFQRRMAKYSGYL
ncbi:zinc finger protein 85 [Trichonephila clavipes]|nr:zinc finger protein 85 [Trichonephila clavipes]